MLTAKECKIKYKIEFFSDIYNFTERANYILKSLVSAEHATRSVSVTTRALRKGPWNAEVTTTPLVPVR